MSNEMDSESSNKDSRKKNNIHDLENSNDVSIRTENGEVEIDILELFKAFWESRKIVYLFVSISIIFSIFVVLFSPKEFLSSATLMPEYSIEGSGGGAANLLQQYGGLIGISGGTYNSSSNAIRVELYPQIVQSISFQDKIAKQEFYFAEYDTVVNMYQYFMEINKPSNFQLIKKYTIGLPFLIIDSFNDDSSEEAGTVNVNDLDGIYNVSLEKYGVLNTTREMISAELDQKSGTIKVKARSNDPFLSAQLAKFTIEELTTYLVDYRTEKVIKDLEYLNVQVDSARLRFENIQVELANFRDSNINLNSNKSRTQEERLEAEFNLSFNIYNTLSQRYEEAKLKVQEETPVFKVLEPIIIPKTDESNGLFTMIVFCLLGLMLSFIFILISLLKNKKNLVRYE